VAGGQIRLDDRPADAGDPVISLIAFTACAIGSNWPQLPRCVDPVECTSQMTKPGVTPVGRWHAIIERSQVEWWLNHVPASQTPECHDIGGDGGNSQFRPSS
jgi:hypothetical protein